MKVLVGIKHVPDTETKIKIAGDGTSIDEAGVKWVISPYDEYALEEALRLREAGTAEEVILVCAGPAAVQPTLRKGLAMGADRAVHVQHDGYFAADGLTRARALAAVARSEDVGLVLLGKYGVGADEWQTGPMLGELLDWPHASAVSKLALDGTKFEAERGVEGAVEVIEGQLPAVISCEKGLNEPRYASLKEIMQAKKKPVAIKTPEELGLETAELTDDRRLVWESLELPPPREGGKMIDGAAEDAARELVRVLREEAKVL